MKNVLEVNDVSKAFIEYKSEFQRLLSWFGITFKPQKRHQVLDGVSFSVRSGESVGIIGRNGAGKSTLLKMITGTLKQSSGEITFNGSISAILELGMGFNLDLTGRQNVYHVAGLMGYPLERIHAVIDEIHDFSDIGDYFDQPVRIYSSGMQARVSFAVATAFRPDLLIVDEALSVGDVNFQSKCFNRMRNLQEQGTSILFVSHDTQAVLSFCDKAILIHDGKIIKQGDPKEIIQKYEHLASDFLDNQVSNEKKATNNKVDLVDFSILNGKGESINSIYSGESVKLKATLKFMDSYSDPHFGIRITNRLGNSVFETNTYCMNIINGRIEKEVEFSLYFEFVMSLSPGEYMFDIGVTNEGYNERQFHEYLSMHNNVGCLTIYENKDDIIFAGYYNMNPKFNLERNRR
ncbi:ABC transporter ATP-binding protein [Vibrio mimicus]